MDRDLIINSNSSGVEIALLEDKYLVELTKEKSNKKYSVGDVYLGKVRKLMPGLNAAFVNVGYEKDAFLHYLDLGPQVRSLIKFTKLANAGKVSNIPLSEFRLEPDIEKNRKDFRCIFGKSADTGTNCQRTHFDQRPPHFVRNILCRQVSGVGSSGRSHLGVAENPIGRRA